MLARLPQINANEVNRYPYTFFHVDSVTGSQATDIFQTCNITGCVVWVQATSVGGTPDFTISVETSKDIEDANFVEVTPAGTETIPIVIQDESVHVISMNMVDLHDFARFRINMQGGDPGDDVITMRVMFLYGDFTHANLSSGGGPQKVTGDLSDGSLSTDSRQLALQFDDAGSGVSYLGEAVAGTATSAASWRIKRITDTAGDIAQEWADGDINFNNIWNNRAALSYS